MSISLIVLIYKTNKKEKQIIYNIYKVIFKTFNNVVNLFIYSNEMEFLIKVHINRQI